MSADRNLLFGILAVQLDFVSKDALIDAMMAHRILINGPIVVTPDAVKLCRPSETVLDLLSQPQRGPFAQRRRRNGH